MLPLLEIRMFSAVLGPSCRRLISSGPLVGVLLPRHFDVAVVAIAVTTSLTAV